METLSYSFHLGSDQNKSKYAKNKSKKNLSGTTSYAKNGIQNYAQLSKVNKHDFRLYDEDTQYIYGLLGSGNVIFDVKETYKNEFEESRLEYNKKQSRPSRMIDDYFKHVSDDEQKDLACEIIIELGNKEFWDTKDLDYKEKMVDVFREQVSDLSKKVPAFKICSAVVHLDETSPHLHIVGVPIKYDNTRGMRKQVGKSVVFTKSSLANIQDYMRERCIESYNNVYGLNAKLKEKQEGRKYNIHGKDMKNYNELMKQIEVNKKSMEKAKEIIEKLDNTSKDLDSIIIDVDPDESNNYTLTEEQMVRFVELNNEVQELEREFTNLQEIFTELSKIKGDIEYLNQRNYELIKQNDSVIKEKQDMEKKLKDLNRSSHFLKSYIKQKEEDHLELVTFLCHMANSDDYIASRTYKKIADDLKEKGFISNKEHRVIFNPPRIINKSEVNKALSSINREMDKSAEEYYKDNTYEL